MGTSKNYHLQIFNAENAKNTQRSQRILKFLEVPLCSKFSFLYAMHTAFFNIFNVLLLQRFCPMLKSQR